LFQPSLDGEFSKGGINRENTFEKFGANSVKMDWAIAISSQG